MLESSKFTSATVTIKSKNISLQFSFVFHIAFHCRSVEDIILIEYPTPLLYSQYFNKNLKCSTFSKAEADKW
jgi:hypothetical protein